MRIFLPARRATVLVPSGPASDPERKHLFIVLTDPRGNPASVAMVSVQSVIRGIAPDATCLLYPGDHQFLKRDSFVAYRHGRIEPAQKLVDGVRQGVLEAREMLEDAVFARVLRGLSESRFVTPAFRDYCLGC